MTDESIIDAYNLTDIDVTPDQLLLDPTNPRIVLKIGRPVDYTLQQLATEEIQDYIFSVVDKVEFHVADLIESIGRDGFLDHGSRMILESVDGTGKFLVLEGNRRLTAIKHLLSDRASLLPHVLESLKSIKAHELVLSNASPDSRVAIIRRILGMLHLTGQLEWGAMERAFFVYEEYVREFRRYYEASRLFHDSDCCQECGERLKIKPWTVRNFVAIYSVYSQLRERDYAVREAHYSLIDLAVRTRGVNYDYFELDSWTLQFSDTGLERFNRLCLEEERVVHNPHDFRSVVRVYNEGTVRDMELLENGELSLEDAVDRADSRSERHNFLHQLEKIDKKMSSLRLAQPAGLKQEAKLVRRIRNIANQILRTLG